MPGAAPVDRTTASALSERLLTGPSSSRGVPRADVALAALTVDASYTDDSGRAPRGAAYLLWVCSPAFDCVPVLRFVQAISFDLD